MSILIPCHRARHTHTHTHKYADSMHVIMIILLFIHNTTYLRANIKQPLNEYGYFINNLLVNYSICYSLMKLMLDGRWWPRNEEELLIVLVRREERINKFNSNILPAICCSELAGHMQLYCIVDFVCTFSAFNATRVLNIDVQKQIGSD